MSLYTGSSPSSPSRRCKILEVSLNPEESELLQCRNHEGLQYHGWHSKALRVLGRSRATLRLLKSGLYRKAKAPQLSDGSSLHPEKGQVDDAGTRSRQAYLHRLGIPVSAGLQGLVPRNSRPLSAWSEEVPKSGGTVSSSIEQVSDEWSSDESESFPFDGQANTSKDVTESTSTEVQTSSHDAAAIENAEDRGSDLQVLPRGDFRLSYLRRLSYEKIWVPRLQQPKKHSSVIVLDWDDTLLCTSFLSNPRISPNGHSCPRLRNVALAAQRLIELSLSLGETIIVTNAWGSWVEHSAKRYVPSLLPLLKEIEVISARQRYEAQFPQQIAKWKMNVFLELQRQRSQDSITNLIVIGDSSFEIDAALAIGHLFPKAVVKTVKFREAPTPEELVKELQLAGDRLRKIVESGKPLQVAMERRSAIQP